MLDALCGEAEASLGHNVKLLFGDFIASAGSLLIKKKDAAARV